jgi:4-hydroxy-tetrahydrodipicolinate synthase
MPNVKVIKPATRVIVPTITFFDEKGVIDEPANELLIQHIIQNRGDSLFLMGSTGEGRFFNDKPDQKKNYLKMAKKAIQKYQSQPLPILIGAYGETPTQVIEDAKACLKVIPTASLVIPPPTTTKLDATQQMQFFDAVFLGLKAPIYLYNNPDNFGGTIIPLEIVQALKEHPNFLGIKDSSASDDQKKLYLKALTEQFTVSCGKEGSLGQFLTFVSKEQRNWVGIIPSISNLVNTCSQIFDFGIAGKDDEMIAMQKELNEFREKINDAKVSKGKAQRGVKIAFAHLYKDKLPKISTFVNPSLARVMEPETIKSICEQTDSLVKKGHITKI